MLILILSQTILRVFAFLFSSFSSWFSYAIFLKASLSFIFLRQAVAFYPRVNKKKKM